MGRVSSKTLRRWVSRKTNELLVETIRLLRRAATQNKAPIWRAAAELLARPRRSRIEVDVGKLAKVTKPNDVVLVPGKLLGGGTLSHPVVVAAFSWSAGAKRKVEATGGKVITIQQLLRENPRGSRVKLVR